jgi:hypothetical protein
MLSTCKGIEMMSARTLGPFYTWQEQVDSLKARIAELESDRAAMMKLITQADPWVQSRMHRHHRKAESEKTPYYRTRHAREADYCEGWLVGAGQFLPPENPRCSVLQNETKP